jgi:ubiquinone/menaquinone biosynthesis C-methylase UbiE
MFSEFEQQYIAARKKEQRYYSNDEVALLPDIAIGHLHYNEWQIRKRSAERLIAYLSKKKKALNILEVGCGNGWLSSKMAKIKNSTVTGIDINGLELEQAKTVFARQKELVFLSGDIRENMLPAHSFDIIVFAASIQYFEVLEDVLNAALQLLQPGGEIHIIDSPFYSEKEVSAARRRSEQYYTSLGYPAMAAFYYHHRMEQLMLFRPTILCDPYTIKNKLTGNKNPFYWICVTNTVIGQHGLSGSGTTAPV